MKLELNDDEIAENLIMIKKFDNENDAIEFLKGERYKNAIDEMWLTVFRPRHKHGYNDKELNDLLGMSWSFEPNEIETKTFTYNELQDKIHLVVDKLEELYREVIRDNIGD